MTTSLVLLNLHTVLAFSNQPDSESLPALRPPQPEIPPGLWEQHGGWLIAGGVLLLAALGAGLWFLMRPKPPVIIPPEAQARLELEPLRQQPETGPVLSRVSQVVRHYVAAAFGLPPGELTTTEFCRAIQGQEQVGPQLAGELGSFLRECDQRKFAPQPPPTPPQAVSQALSLIAQAEARRAQLRQAAEQTTS